MEKFTPLAKKITLPPAVMVGTNLTPASQYQKAICILAFDAVFSDTEFVKLNQYSQILRRQYCLSPCAPVRVDFQDIKVFVRIDRRHLPDLVAGTQHGNSQVYLT